MTMAVQTWRADIKIGTEALYRVIGASQCGFQVEIRTVHANLMTVNGFDTQEEAEWWILRHKELAMATRWPATRQFPQRRG